jgi:hypothetical protein
MILRAFIARPPTVPLARRAVCSYVLATIQPLYRNARHMAASYRDLTPAEQLVVSVEQERGL